MLRFRIKAILKTILDFLKRKLNEILRRWVAWASILGIVLFVLFLIICILYFIGTR